jgi:hypothetical protein
MDLDLGSKETETLLKLLNEFYEGPNNIKELVPCLREKGYSKDGAYRYGHRVLEIKRIFHDRTISEEARKRAEDMKKGVPFLDMINLAIDDPRLTEDEKLRYSVDYLDELARHVLKRLNIKPRTSEEKPDQSYIDRYNKLCEHGLV